MRKLVPLHVEKKAIRVLGIAESFSPSSKTTKKKKKFSTLAGVVMRSDLVIDGLVIGRTTVSGSDATASLAKLYSKLGRNDVNALVLSGSVLSLYNVVDVDLLSKKIKLPVLALTFKKSKADLGANIKARFPPKVASSKIKLLGKLGMAEQVRLSTGYYIFVRASGLSKLDSKRLIEKFTLQGAVPEPVRVARLLAKTVASAT